MNKDAYTCPCCQTTFSYPTETGACTRFNCQYYCEGAAVAFGIIGMAYAIRSNSMTEFVNELFVISTSAERKDR